MAWIEPVRVNKDENPRLKAKQADKRSQRHDHASCDRPPASPDGLDSEYDSTERHRHELWTLNVRWDPVETDTLGQPIRIRRYNLEWSLSRDEGAHWRKAGTAHVPARSTDNDKDDDPDPSFDYSIKKIKGRFTYRWRVQAEAQGGCQGAWSAWEDAGEAVETPPPPTNLTLDVDEHALHVRWKIPDDPEHAGVKDLRITHVHVEVFRDEISNDNLVDEDTFRKGEHAHFKLRQPPKDDTFIARARCVSANGATSTPVTTSATKDTPSQPGQPTITFDAQGPRHARYRAFVAVQEVADTDFEIKGYRVEFADKRTSGAPTNGTDRDRKFVKAKGTNRELSVTFRGVPADNFTYARTQAVDKDNKESAWSDWRSGGKPSASDTVPALTDIEYITARRRIGVKWKVPMVAGHPDERIGRIRIQIATDTGFLSIVDEAHKHPGHGSYRYSMPADQVGTQFYLRIRPEDDADNVGAWQPSDTGQPMVAEADEAGALPSPPGKPANPSGSFDVNGTRHARYRVVVTPGVSSTGGAADVYRLAMAHSATSGSTPPAGTKRRYAGVDADATGDDRTHTWGNVPKRHFVWIRERARNAGGASAWTDWISLGRPIDSAATSTPPAVTNLNVYSATPRRVTGIITDPDDDEVIGWRVITTRTSGASPGLVEDVFVRNPQHTYRVPRVWKNETHSQQWRALNYMKVESVGVTASTGQDPDDTVPIGSVHMHQGGAIPAGYLRCNGAVYATSLHPSLFAVIGYLYGGSGTSFAVPDYRKRGPRGVGDTFSPTYQVGSPTSLSDNEGQNELNRIELTDQHGGSTADDTGGHTHGPGTLTAQGTTGSVLDVGGSGSSAARQAHTHTNFGGETGQQGSRHTHGSGNAATTGIKGVSLSVSGGGDANHEGHARRAYQRTHFVIRAS